MHSNNHHKIPKSTQFWFLERTCCSPMIWLFYRWCPANSRLTWVLYTPIFETVGPSCRHRGSWSNIRGFTWTNIRIMDTIRCVADLCMDSQHHSLQSNTNQWSRLNWTYILWVTINPGLFRRTWNFPESVTKIWPSRNPSISLSLSVPSNLLRALGDGLLLRLCRFLGGGSMMMQSLEALSSAFMSATSTFPSFDAALSVSDPICSRFIVVADLLSFSRIRCLQDHIFWRIDSLSPFFLFQRELSPHSVDGVHDCCLFLVLNVPIMRWYCCSWSSRTETMNWKFKSLLSKVEIKWKRSECGST